MDRDQLHEEITKLNNLLSLVTKLNKQIVKMLREFREIEQILGKALGYPWFKDDQCNFPNATEADGVAIGDHTAWSLAHQAADRIKELAEEVDRHNARVYKLSLEEWRTFDQS